MVHVGVVVGLAGGRAESGSRTHHDRDLADHPLTRAASSFAEPDSCRGTDSSVPSGHQAELDANPGICERVEMPQFPVLMTPRTAAGRRREYHYCHDRGLQALSCPVVFVAVVARSDVILTEVLAAATAHLVLRLVADAIRMARYADHMCCMAAQSDDSSRFVRHNRTRRQPERQVARTKTESCCEEAS